jgi:hypothetical protein
MLYSLSNGNYQFQCRLLLTLRRCTPQNLAAWAMFSLNRGLLPELFAFKNFKKGVYYNRK